jgi:hypothetical protein
VYADLAESYWCRVSRASLLISDLAHETYVFLLLMHMANLEPDVFLAEGPRRVSDDVTEALQPVSYYGSRN